MGRKGGVWVYGYWREGVKGVNKGSKEKKRGDPTGPRGGG